MLESLKLNLLACARVTAICHHAKTLNPSFSTLLRGLLFLYSPVSAAITCGQANTGPYFQLLVQLTISSALEDNASSLSPSLSCPSPLIFASFPDIHFYCDPISRSFYCLTRAWNYFYFWQEAEAVASLCFCLYLLPPNSSPLFPTSLHVTYSIDMGHTHTHTHTHKTQAI